MVRLVIALLVGLCPVSFAHDLEDELSQAPPGFSHQSSNAVFANFRHITLQLTFDVKARTATGRSIIEFETEEKGRPLFDFRGTISSANLDETSLGNIATISAPNSATQLRILDRDVEPGEHQLVIHFSIPSSEITYSTTGVKIGFFMGDVGTDRNFLERYVPANLEYDQFAMDVSIELVGGTKNHQLFANGQVSHPVSNLWFISYPDYFTTSSFYLHFTEANFPVAQELYQGIATQYPITVYSSTQSAANDGLSRAKKILAELETTYGAFAHQQVIAYIAGEGGMEHCGATMTSLGALGHELTHSWFARGVMPAIGNAGWIDEAVASWRDNGYPVGSEPSGSSVNLAGFSPYRRTTPDAAYTRGADFMSDLDYLFKSKGGLKAALRQLFSQYQRKTITTPLFADAMTAFSGMNLSRYFDRYVYGKNRNPRLGPSLPRITWHNHPRPYTREELVQFR